MPSLPFKTSFEKMSKTPDFRNSGSVTFFTLLTSNFMQTFWKNNEQSLKDGLTQGHTDKGDY